MSFASHTFQSRLRHLQAGPQRLTRRGTNVGPKEQTIPPPSSLYERTAVRCLAKSSDPNPPGTRHTARIESIDNDVAALMIDAGVVR